MNEIDAKEELQRWFAFDAFIRELKGTGLEAVNVNVRKDCTMLVLKERAAFMGRWQVEAAVENHGYKLLSFDWIGQGTFELNFI